MSKQEAIEQFRRFKEAGEKQFAEDAPHIQAELKSIQIPLNFSDTVSIYRWLWRKQIKFEMLPKTVLDEFKETRHYLKITAKIERDSNA